METINLSGQQKRTPAGEAGVPKALRMRRL
jgi:hypothetical protein